MTVQNFVIDLIEALLNDKELELTEQDIRFYDKGTTAETDAALDDHIKGDIISTMIRRDLLQVRKV